MALVILFGNVVVIAMIRAAATVAVKAIVIGTISRRSNSNNSHSDGGYDDATAVGIDSAGGDGERIR